MPENLLEEKSAVQPTELESVDPSSLGGSPACELPASGQLIADALSNRVNPADLLLTDVWIVDSGAEMVFSYLGAASRKSGSQTAGASFELAAGNTNPTDIANPSVGPGVQPDPARSEAGDPNSISRAFTEQSPSDGDIDSLFTTLDADFFPPRNLVVPAPI
jgi:hypothetical protein